MQGIHEGRWVDPQLGGRVHAAGGRWPYCKEGHSGLGRGRLTSLASNTAWRLHPAREGTAAAEGRPGVGAACWGILGWVRPSLPMVWRRGFCSPGPPPWQSLERVVSVPPASWPLPVWGPVAHPLRSPPATSQARPAPSTLVLTVPGPLPRCSAVAPLAPSPCPAARWKHRPDVGTVAHGGGEEVARGCPPGE